MPRLEGEKTSTGRWVLGVVILAAVAAALWFAFANRGADEVTVEGGDVNVVDNRAGNMLTNPGDDNANNTASGATTEATPSADNAATNSMATDNTAGGNTVTGDAAGGNMATGDTTGTGDATQSNSATTPGAAASATPETIPGATPGASSATGAAGGAAGGSKAKSGASSSSQTSSGTAAGSGGGTKY